MGAISCPKHCNVIQTLHPPTDRTKILGSVLCNLHKEKVLALLDLFCRAADLPMLSFLMPAIEGQNDRVGVFSQRVYTWPPSTARDSFQIFFNLGMCHSGDQGRRKRKIDVNSLRSDRKHLLARLALLGPLVLLLALVVTSRPVMAQNDPDFGAIDDPLDGDYEVFTVDDFVIYRTLPLQAAMDVINYVFETENEQISSQTKRLATSPGCYPSNSRQPQQTRVGHFFNQVNDVIVTLAPAFPKAQGPNCTTNDGSPNMSLHINVGMFKQKFYIMPADSVGAAALRPPSGTLSVENAQVVAAPPYGEGVYVVSADIRATAGPVEAVEVLFFDGDPEAQAIRLHDVDVLPFVSQEQSDAVSIPFQPVGCGAKKLVIVARSGASNSGRQALTFNVPCPPLLFPLIRN